ncbi:MAG: ABC transporter substrate-binding protein [Deltaproteobacteria bacterium]|nr:ABC transporter substrate-binding protein [Deltaproteobacteria bacterium]
MKIKTSLIIGFFVFWTIFTGCTKSDSESKNESTNIQNKLVVGLVSLMTGSHAVYGKNVHNGVMMALEEINASGGIEGQQIEVILEDEGSDPKGAVNAVQKLISVNKVPVIIGPASSSGTIAAAPIANREKVVLLSPGAASPNISNAGEYIFRNRASGSAESIAIAEFATKSLSITKAAILQITTDYGVGFCKVFEKRFKELGGNIIGIEYFDAGKTDFKAQITKLKNLEPEAIYIIGVPIEVGKILKQMKELGLNSIILTNNMESPELLKNAGNAAEGIYFAIPKYDPHSKGERIREFNSRYTAKFSYDSDMFAANGYDAVYIVAKAIRIGGYSGEGIKNALHTEMFEAVNGNVIRFDSNGDVIKPLVIKTVKSGKFERVEIRKP